MSQFSNKINFEAVPDPYYKGPEGFEEVLDILEDSTEVLLKRIMNEIESESNN
jgi:protein-tyrosine phosphatase